LTLLFDWKERNGPPHKRTRRPGFGSKLIHTVIERQLNGKVQQSFGPKGMETKLTIPLTHERWPGTVAVVTEAPPTRGTELPKASAAPADGPGPTVPPRS
jgi:hypothetical protein